MSFQHYVISTLITLSAATVGLAEVVHTPSGNPFPSDTKLHRDAAGNSILVWVASDGLVASADPGGPPRSDGVKLPFMTDACLVDGPRGTHQLGSTTYRVLVRASADGSSIEEYYGWADERLLVLVPHAEKDDVTTVYRKVMIVNTEEDLHRARADKGYEPLVPIRLQPRLDGKRLEPCRLFSIFFKWGEIKNKDGHFVLVGPDWDFSNRDSIKVLSKAVLGWVPADRIARWNKREALDWDEDSTRLDAQPRRLARGYVWNSPDQALSALEFVKRAKPGESPPFKDSLIPEGWDENGCTVPLARDEMRFPILEIPDEDKTILDSHGRDPDWAPIRVGVVGDFVDETGQVIATKNVILNLHKTLANLQGQMSTIEILFVIDGTSSMKDVFERVARVIESFGDKIKDKAQHVRVAVTIYNDNHDRPDAAVKTMPLADINARRAGKTVLGELRDYKTIDGEDLLENVFEGLVRGVEQANFSPEALKMVILLGDAGDRDAHASRKKMSAAIEEATNVLSPPNERPIEFFAIQVRAQDEDRPGYREAMQVFESQMSEVVAALKSMGKASERFAECVPAANLDIVELRIQERVIKLAEQAEQTERELANTERTKIGRNPLGAHVRAAIERRNPDFSKILNSPSGVQLFSPGYAWIHRTQLVDIKRPDAFRLCLLLEKADIDSLLVPLNELLEHYSTAPDKGIEVLTSIVAGQVGEGKNKNLSWEEHAKLKARGLTVTSAFLNEKIRSLTPNLFSLQQLYDLEHKRDLLHDIVDGKRFRYIATPERRANGTFTRMERSGEHQRDDRAHKLGGRDKDDKRGSTSNWYWVDKMREWP